MIHSSKPLLSYDDQSIIAELTDKHQVTQKNTRLLVKYYTHFIKTLNIQTLTPTLRKTLAEIALIFTQKSNFYLTLQGSQRPGICFSMNDILKRKSYSQISNLITLARQVIDTVKFREPSLKFETLQLLQYIQKGLRQAILFEKLCWVFLKNTLENSSQTQSYKEKLINFSWYLYIDVKSNCFQKDSGFGQNKMLMVSVLETIVLNSLTYVSPLILQKNSPKRYCSTPAQQKKEVMSSILEILLKQAEINPAQIIEYQEVNQTFNSYFDRLVSAGIIKSFSEQSFDFLCHRSLQANFRKIDRKISKQIQSSQIDLRRLISYELTIEKDHKKTAIEDKLIVKHKRQQKTKIINQEPPKKYKSHRVLNLDNCEIEMTSQSVITESQVSFPSKLFGATMRMSIPGLQVRSDNDNLKRFLIQKVRDYMGNVTSYQTQIIDYIEGVMRKITERQSFGGRVHFNATKSDKIFQAYEFYTYLIDYIWTSSSRFNKQYILEQSDSTHECLLIIAIGTILLVYQNSNDSSNPFLKLLYCQKPDMMDFFYALICVQEMDLPIKLQKSLKQVMQTVVNELLWTEKGFIEEISMVRQHITQIHQQSTGKLALTCILEQVSSYVSQKVKQISTNLSRGYSPQSQNYFVSLCQQSVSLTLSFIIYSPQLFFEHSIDQLILCSMYGMSKFLKMSIRFHELIEAYRETIQSEIIQSQIQFENTVLSVKNSFSEDLVDIIGFYNAQFIGYLNYAFEIVADRERMKLVQELCGKLNESSDYLSPFRQNQQAIILSPRLKKSKSQTHNLRSIQRIHNKQNHEANTGHSISINLEHEDELGIVSFVSDESQKLLSNSSHAQGKIEINLQFNQANSRNPTRVKERKLIEERQNELCVTHKGKHPIFAELRKIDEQ